MSWRIASVIPSPSLLPTEWWCWQWWTAAQPPMLWEAVVAAATELRLSLVAAANIPALSIPQGEESSTGGDLGRQQSQRRWEGSIVSGCRSLRLDCRIRSPSSFSTFCSLAEDGLIVLFHLFFLKEGGGVNQGESRQVKHVGRRVHVGLAAALFLRLPQC